MFEIFSAFHDITLRVDASNEVELSEINSLKTVLLDDHGQVSVGQKVHNTVASGKLNRFLFDTAAGSLRDDHIGEGVDEGRLLGMVQVWIGLELARGMVSACSLGSCRT